MREGREGKRRPRNDRDRRRHTSFVFSPPSPFPLKMMEALEAVRSAAAEGMRLMNQRALLDATVDELVGSGGENLGALRATLLAALDAEPALPRSIVYLYLLCVFLGFYFWFFLRPVPTEEIVKGALQAWERQKESERASAAAVLRTSNNSPTKKYPMPRSLTFSPSTPKNLSTLPKNHSDAAWHASTDADAPRLADLSAAFASSVDPELAREAAPRLAAVLRRMSAFYSSQGAPRCSLLPLTMALRKMQRSGCPAPPGGGGGSAGGEITPLHPLLFEAALQAQNPRAALPVLDDLLGGAAEGRRRRGGGSLPLLLRPPRSRSRRRRPASRPATSSSPSTWAACSAPPEGSGTSLRRLRLRDRRRARRRGPLFDRVRGPQEVDARPRRRGARALRRA